MANDSTMTIPVLPSRTLCAELARIAAAHGMRLAIIGWRIVMVPNAELRK